MRIVHRVLLAAAAALSACAGSGMNADETPASQEYAVYNSVIRALFFDSVTARSFDLVGEEPGLVVIEAETQLGSFTKMAPVGTEDFLLRELPALEHGFFRHFLAKNEQPLTLDESRFEVSVPVLLVRGDSARAIVGYPQDWQAYYARYPYSQGILRLSRVAFGDGGSRALVYAANSRGTLDAAGYYLLLQRARGRWVIVAHVLRWIS